MKEIEVIIGVFTVAVSIISSISAVLVKDAVSKATTKIIVQQLIDKDDEQQIKITKLEAELDRVASNQDKKITSIEHLNKKFDDFKEDHIREVSGMKSTLEENTRAIHQLTGTLSVFREYLIKK